MKDSDRLEIILEEVRGQYQAMQEGLDNLQSVPHRISQVEGKVDRVEVKLDLVADVIKNHSRRLAKLEG